MTKQRDARLSDRNEARTKLEAKIASQRKVLDDPSAFTTVDPSEIIADAQFRLRWLDCAPEGSKFVIAPLCDKQGVPCGMARDENVGPGEGMRAALAKHAPDGNWITVVTTRWANRAVTA